MVPKIPNPPPRPDPELQPPMVINFKTPRTKMQNPMFHESFWVRFLTLILVRVLMFSCAFLFSAICVSSPAAGFSILVVVLVLVSAAVAASGQ